MDLSIVFNLAELKAMQSILIERIKQDDEQHNVAYLPHRELVEKLEYFITELESQYQTLIVLG